MKRTGSPAQELAALLEKRLQIVADREFRERDAEAHLAALQRVSEAIDSTYQELKPQLTARLRHFMDQASYSKALSFLRESEGKS